MIGKRAVIGAAVLASAAQAQVVSHSSNGYALSVNIPSDSVSGSGSIFMQISAPSGTQWVGFGQGTRMANANMFVVYTSGGGNVTISPRSAPGEVMPTLNTNSQVVLLQGSGVSSDGSFVANLRCDNCLGSVMSATSTSSNWIYAYKGGSSLDTTNPSATIQQHDIEGTFSLDLTQGTGGSSSNPFIQQSSSPTSGGSSSTVAPTASQSASGTGSVSAPLASSNPNTSSDSGSTTGSTETLTLAHGVIMSLLFLGLFPFSSLTIYLGIQNKVRFIHAPAQIVNSILLLVGLALGVIVGRNINQLDQYHQIIGYIVVVVLILFQPALGIVQHLRYRKDGSKTVFGVAHRWLGRSILLLGLINGGLGWQIAGTTSAYIPYAVIAAIVGVIYVGVVVWKTLRSDDPVGKGLEKGSPNSSSYEMKGPKVGHTRLASAEDGQDNRI